MFLAATLLPTTLPAAEPALTPAAERAVERGLRWVAARAQPDGSLVRTPAYAGNVAVTSLCGLALAAGGHLPSGGEHAATVGAAVNYVLDRAEPGGLIAGPNGRGNGPMYGHGFAVLFLAELDGETGDRDLRPTLAAAVRLIVDSQNAAGGWRYTPGTEEADVSVTVCQVAALRAARNAGYAVPGATIDRAVGYLRSCRNPADGGFFYRTVQRDHSEFARSAAAVSALQAAGVYAGDDLDRGLAYLTRFRPDGTRRPDPAYFHYGHYYASLAFWQAGGDRRGRWFPAVRDDLVRRQKRLADMGYWADRNVCDEYATAMTLLALQVPAERLPFFVR